MDVGLDGVVFGGIGPTGEPDGGDANRLSALNVGWQAVANHGGASQGSAKEIQGQLKDMRVRFANADLGRNPNAFKIGAQIVAVYEGVDIRGIGSIGDEPQAAARAAEGG